MQGWSLLYASYRAYLPLTEPYFPELFTFLRKIDIQELFILHNT